MPAKIMFLPMYANRITNAEFVRSLIGRDSKVITLENGSCNYRAATVFQELMKPSSIKTDLVEVASFPDGVNLLRKASANHLMLVPCIHEVTRQLDLDNNFTSVKFLDFILTNPGIYLASKNGLHPNSLPIKDRRVAAIKPLATLVSDETLQVVEANSTQDAARKVALGLIPFCITNEEGVYRNDLRIIEEAESMDMLWRFFKRVA